MKNKKYSLFKARKRISKCKKRLHNLEIQNFTFSKNIYTDLQKLEKKIMQPTLLGQLWNKKIPVIAGSVIVISILLAISIIFPSLVQNGLFGASIENQMEITVNNLENEMIISSDHMITGSTSYPDGEVSFVQVKIDNNDWENASGINQWAYWEYNLAIDSFDNGSHNVSVRCCDGVEFSSVEYTIYINKTKILERPTVSITSPTNGENVSGNIQVKGEAMSKDGEIKKVEIEFDRGGWIEVNGLNNWNYTLDSDSLIKGDHTISARSFDGELFSNISEIKITINEIKEEDNETRNITILQSGSFKLSFLQLGEKVVPGQRYEIQGRHQKMPEDKFNYDQITVLGVDETKDWLNISIPEEEIVTPADGKWHYFSIYLEITDEAEQNAEISFIFLCSTRFFILNEPLITSPGMFWKDLSDDYWIETGEW